MNEMEDLLSDFRGMLERFDEIQLAVLRTHISIHREAVRRISVARGVSRSALPRLRFMDAVEEAYPEKHLSDLRNVLQKLDSVRNELAHDDDTSAYLAKLGEFVRAARPGQYKESTSFSEVDTQRFEALAFVHNWVVHA